MLKSRGDNKMKNISNESLEAKLNKKITIPKSVENHLQDAYKIIRENAPDASPK